jgi:hypothetical protein
MRCILFVVVVAACDSGALTCKDAVTKARSADEAMSFDAAARLVGRCELAGWSVATRQCIAQAKSPHDLEVCTAKLAPEDHEQTSAQMAAMIRFKAEMCQCSTSACAQHVSDEMTKWAQAQATDQQELPRMSEADTKAFTEVGEQMAMCMQKAMSADLVPPPTEALPNPPVPR